MNLNNYKETLNTFLDMHDKQLIDKLVNQLLKQDVIDKSVVRRIALDLKYKETGND